MANEITSSKNVGSTNNSQSVPPNVERLIEVKNVPTVTKGEKSRMTKEEFLSLTSHKFASFLPPIVGKYEIAALKEGIRVHGLLEPITIFEGKILDGRNRHRAICELVKEDSSFDFEANLKIADLPQGIAPEKYVITKNLHRRNLNESQRAYFAAKMLLEFKEDKTLSREEKANLPKGPKTDHFGKIFNVSGTMVKSAQIVIKHGIPMVNTFVQNGSWKLNMARKVALLDSKNQESFFSTAEKEAISASNAWFEGLKARAEAKVADCKEAEKEATAEKERKVKLNLELLNSSLSTVTDKKQIGRIKSDIAKLNAGKPVEETVKYFKALKNAKDAVSKAEANLKELMSDSEAKKKRYAENRKSREVFAAYRLYIRAVKESSVAVFLKMNASGPDIEFKSILGKDAAPSLGVLATFSSASEAERYISENGEALGRLKTEILASPIAEAGNKIQAYIESLKPEVKAA